MDSRRQGWFHFDWNRLSTTMRIFLLFSIFLIHHPVSPQEVLLNKSEKLISEFKLDSASIILDGLQKNPLEKKHRARLHYLRGNIFFSKSEHDKAFGELIEARKFFRELKDPCNTAAADLLIIEVLSHQPKSMVDSQSFLDEFMQTSVECGNPVDEAIAYSKLAVVYLKADDGLKAVRYFDRAINLAQKLGEKSYATNWMFNKGVVYNTTLKQYDSALFYFKLTEPFFKENQSQEFLSYNYNNQAEAYKKINDFQTAIMYYQKADSIPLRRFNLKTKRIYYENLTDLYGQINQFDSAFHYASQLLKIKDSINEASQNVNMARIKEQYDNEKLRADNLEMEARRMQNRNIALALGGSLFGVSVIGSLLYKNERRKHRIAEQQRELEIRKAEKLLKEQELATIDAMVAGQEKERERLAGELHDSVGATLAAARLQFEYLKDHRGRLPDEEELFQKTGTLLEDAYVEIRTMAHAKNEGVIAKNGLLPAVQKLVKNVSVSNNLQIDLHYFGLENRLENSLEITIFRVIQELVTNIIKHSKASEARISMTQLDDSLSVIVEDNGQGFDYRRVEPEEGMGLANIERRVERMEGTMEIDSTIGKGTTVLIDIPI